jgi:hypothetical protein
MMLTCLTRVGQVKNGKALSSAVASPEHKEQLRMFASTAYVVRAAALNHMALYPQAIKDASLGIQHTRHTPFALLRLLT